jgi:hypothetical protein
MNRWLLILPENDARDLAGGSFVGVMREPHLEPLLTPIRRVCGLGNAYTQDVKNRF